MINSDASLYIDTTCYNCKKPVALSNACNYDGRAYCFSCYERLGFGKIIEQEFGMDLSSLCDDCDPYYMPKCNKCVGS
jgi:hypothetical protein